MAKTTVEPKSTKAKATATKSTDLKAAELKAATVPRVEFQAPKLSEALVSECREKLLITKADLLNRVREARSKLDQFERGGDEADQTMRILAEQEVMSQTDRLRSQLMEIESALGRIENGSYGFCEETEEIIETERLKAIPWTRLSIEGAEIRESVDKRYAR